jgi:biopolymer transport protein ExbD
MSRFRRTSREVPGLNLAALPDLIFTVLFFFMIVTHMRDVEPKVRYQVPQGSELVKDVKKAGLIYILIGKPVDAQGRVVSNETRIQLNNRIVTVDEIPALIDEARQKMSDDERQLLTVSIRADRDTEMGIINDVKQALRRAGALNINYSAGKKFLIQKRI